jgi:hypothetical protein
LLRKNKQTLNNGPLSLFKNCCTHSNAKTGAVNFTNLKVQIANAPSVILLHQSVSPTKLRPTSPVHSTRKYAQVLYYMLITEWY